MEKRLIKEYLNLLHQFYQKYKKEIEEKEVGVMLSGGIDSSIIAYFTHLYFKKTSFFTLSFDEKSDDLFHAQILAKKLDKKLEVIFYQKEDILKIKNKILEILEKNKVEINPMQKALASAFFLVCQKVKEKNISYLFTGQGPDILLAGYHKYKNISKNNINEEIKKDIPLLEIDKKRDSAVAKIFNIKLVNPYLEKDFVDFTLEIPEDFKINLISGEAYEKYLSRKVGKFLKLPKEIILRHKKALQYSTKIIKKISG
jgi:asparagine synthase (glutamine-hydrolysing)